MNNIRLNLSRAALRAALLLMRFGRWLIRPSLLAPAPCRVSAPNLFNRAASVTSDASPQSSTVRRVRLDIPFFVEADREFIAADAPGLLRSKVNPVWPRATQTHDLLKFRAGANRKRAWGTTGTPK